ncbi:MAG TPA: PQQ-binding-like beta-propeller repeat protein [Candidatus Acidoferrales bacterium]|nr:PQQ-binding-like beta-propeller repeat protein [Candidatus Acidoferrales bacterium]
MRRQILLLFFTLLILVPAWEAVSVTVATSHVTHGQVLKSTIKEAGSILPILIGSVVYVGSSDHNLYPLDARTGTKIWNYKTGDVVESSPAVANGIVYIGSWDHNLYAFNATTGMKIWNYPTGDTVHCSPITSRSIVYVGSEDKNVYALNATAGTKMWNYTTGGPVVSSPTVTNGIVLHRE